MSRPWARPLALAVLATALAGVPAPASAARESRVVEGVLVEQHGDLPNGGGSAPRYFIRSPAGETRVEGPQPASLVGQRVRATDEDPARAGVQGEARAVRAPRERAAALSAAGPRTVLVVLLTLADAPSPAASADAARSDVFTSPTSASARFSAQSGGSTYLTGIRRTDGDVAGPFALPISGSGCPYRPIATAADRAAADAGWLESSYQHVVYVLPYVADCDWAGVGELPGRRSWLNGTAGGSGITLHELGHNLGAHHATTISCTDRSGQPVTLSEACSTSEYGDPFDRMGRGSGLMSTFHRAQVGQLPAGDQVSLTRAATIRLATADAVSGTRLALIPRKDPRQPVTSYYALERRAPQAPFDTFGVSDPVVTGVSIRVVPRLDQPIQTKLLDATPQTAGNFFDAALQPGQTFRDVPRGISVTVGADPSAITVTLPDLVDDVPPSAGYLWASRAGDSAVGLQWSAAVDDEDATLDYELSRDGQLLLTTGQTAITVADDGQAHSFALVAVDDAGNRSAPVTAATPAAFSPPPPPPPGNPSPLPGGPVPPGEPPPVSSSAAGQAPPTPISARARSRPRALTMLSARRDRAGRLVVRLRCGATVRCAGTVLATNRSRRRVARARVSAPPGRVVSVPLARAPRRPIPAGPLVLRFISRAGSAQRLGTVRVPRGAGRATIGG